MSSNLSEYPPVAPSGNRDYTDFMLPSRTANSVLREWLIAALLLGLTILSTSFAGFFYIAGDIGFLDALHATLARPGLLLRGLPFSVPLILILLAHELGHFFACRYYGMSCTPPFFIPVPISIAGTLGAFIKIRSQFLNRRALFDIGVAGPLAGFVLAVPTLWVGIHLSKLIPKGALGQGQLLFGEPLIFRYLGSVVLGYSPATQEMIAHPTAMAAWVGFLATSLNLFPIWQLDGGHICYAILGRTWQKRISIVSALVLILISLLGWPIPSYLLFGVLLLIIGARWRFYHPPTLAEEEKLGPVRLLLGVVALLILILSFTPVPVSIS